MSKSQQFFILAGAVVTLFVLLSILYLIYPTTYLPISDKLPYFILLGVGIVSVLIAILVWLIVRKESRPQRDGNTQILKIFLFVIIGLSATVILTINLEYVPATYSKTVHQGNPPVDLSVVVTRESFIKIPLQNVLINRTSNFKVEVYTKPNISNILGTSLIPLADSVLTIPDLKNSSTNNHYIAYTSLNARHDGVLTNKTYPYAIDIFYNNTNGTGIQKYSIPFEWPIQKMDFSMVNYFWIVLIGVITSRLSKRYAELHTSGTQQQRSNVYLKPTDFLWMGFSAIIALLIFSSFEENVNLTNFIITNMSVAFGFGFGFDKILEAGQQFLNK